MGRETYLMKQALHLVDLLEIFLCGWWWLGLAENGWTDRVVWGGEMQFIAFSICTQLLLVVAVNSASNIS